MWRRGVTSGDTSRLERIIVSFTVRIAKSSKIKLTRSTLRRSSSVAGGKRPLSSQSPYIIEDSQTGMIFAGGCAGGSRIISANTQIARNCLDYDMSPFEALSAPRVHNQLAPNVTLLEMDDEAHEFKGFSVNQEKDFIERGHVVERVEIGLSTSCAIKWTREKGWEASGEPRKFDAGGVVIGKEERQ